MSQLDKVTKGRFQRPYAITVFGPDGIGKSTLGEQAPRSIFLGPEVGTSNLDVSRFPTPESWGHMISAANELVTASHDYKTLVLDSLDWCEPLLFKHICREYNVSSIELAAGGFGKGYVIALNYWQELKDCFEKLRNLKGMNILLLAHSDVVTFTDPQTQLSYQRYEMKLHKRASAFWREYCDAVLFANFETYTKKSGEKMMTYSDGARILHTERRPGWDAKNRFGMPLKIDLSWGSIVNAIDNAAPMSLETVRQRIDGLLTCVTDIELKEKVIGAIEKAGDNVTQLNAIANRLSMRLGES